MLEKIQKKYLTNIVYVVNLYSSLKKESMNNTNSVIDSLM